MRKLIVGYDLETKETFYWVIYVRESGHIEYLGDFVGSFFKRSLLTDSSRSMFMLKNREKPHYPVHAIIIKVSKDEVVTVGDEIPALKGL